MKNFTIIHVLLFILLLLTYTCASGQTEDDYFVTVTLDTVYGKIKPMDFGPEPKVQVQTADNKKTVYSIFETKFFTYRGEQYFPVKHFDRYTFMKLLIPGYLSLYAFQPENQNNYDGLFLQKLDGTAIEVPNLGFKKNMSRFLSDCGDIGDRISNGEFNRTKLDSIVWAYNQCILKNTEQQQKIITAEEENLKKSDPWKALDEQIRSHKNFDQKSEALEIITEIIKKVSQGDKVPAFMVDGLKSNLENQTDLKTPLETALKTLAN